VGKDKRVGRSSVKTKMIYYKERKGKERKGKERKGKEKEGPKAIPKPKTTR